MPNVKQSLPSDLTIDIGTCFREAYEYLMALSDAGNAQGYWLVHGIVSRNANGREVVHAWIERASDDSVIDISNDNSIRMRRATFYERYRIKHEVRYTAQDAILQYLLRGGCGLWESSLLALLGTEKGDNE